MDAAEPFPYPPDDPVRLHELAIRCRRCASRCAEVADDLTGHAARPVAAWRGPAASAFRAEVRATARLVRRAAGPLREASVVLEGFRSALLRARTAIDRVRAGYDDELARQRRELALVSADATVPAQLRRLRSDELRWSHQHELGAYHRRYATIIDALRVDACAARRALGSLAWSVVPADGQRSGSPADSEARLVDSLPLLQAQRLLVAPAGRPPIRGTPAGVVRLWWSLLSVDEQERLAVASAAAVGNLDGLPAHVRSRANELVLDRLVASLRRPDRALDAAERRTLDNCLSVRREIDLLRRSRDLRTRADAVVQLLVFDPGAFHGEGRAAIAVGDVDTADHVAFLVPGLHSTMRESLPALVGNAALLSREADRAGAGSVTAAVAWMGYDAPSLFNVAGDGAAEAGADLLAADVMAVQSARDVAPHVTVIGHSYGSTTAGTALRDHVTGVDDAVLVGSPGPNVEHVSTLHVPAGHVFVGASSRDPVSYLDRFGLDPTHEAFGAVRFRAEDVTRNSWRVDVDDHSKYFEPKTESLSNIVRIVVGSYAEVEVAAYREEWPILPDGINTDPEADREPTVPAG